MLLINLVFGITFIVFAIIVALVVVCLSLTTPSTSSSSPEMQSRDIIIESLPEVTEPTPLIDVSNSLSRDITISNSEIEITSPEIVGVGDPYIQSFSTHLFDFNGKVYLENDENRVLYNKSDPLHPIYFLSNYHHQNLKKTSINIKSDFPNSKMIILDGEPTSLADIPIGERDIILSTKRERSYLPRGMNMGNYVYLPYYAYYYLFEKKLDIEKLIKSEKNIYPEKTKFCAFAYSNCDERFRGVVNRKNFYYLMQEITGGRVDNLGRCYSSSSDTVKRGKNEDIFSPYKFVICIENEDIDGYITEKLINPMYCGSIPIYLGAKDVGEHFNTKSFIHVRDFESWEDCIRYVIQVDNDESLRAKILAEPWFHGNTPNQYFQDLLQRGSDFYKGIYSLVKKDNIINVKNYLSQKLHFVTFSDGVKYTFDRIVKEAIKTNYFDKIYSYLPSDLSQEFLDKNSGWILSNPRGYGYYVWKPQVVLQALNKIKDGEYLLWSDSGSTLIGGKSGKLIEYLEKLSPSSPIIGFKMHWRTREWVKKDLVRFFQKKYNVTDDEIVSFVDDFSFTAGYFFMMKCDLSVKIVKEWGEIMSENYHLIDDSPSIEEEDPVFKENRYDQSVLDLLLKYYASQYSLDNFNDLGPTQIADERVLFLSRIKK